MIDLNPDDTEGLLDFFILQTLSQEPLPVFVVEQRTQRVHQLLEIAAERRRTQTPPSPAAALQRLERAGCVEAKNPRADPISEKVYSLTSMGREWLQVQRAGWSSTLARYVDAGGLDDSFRRFLNGEI